MARYAQSIESQATQLSGVNSTTTVNGYIGCLTASATAGFRLRRVVLGLRTTTGIPPVIQQVGVGIYRQTVLPSGTGLSAAQLGQAQEPWTLQTDPTAGTLSTTTTTIGTTGPTLASVPVARLTFNSQNSWDYPYEMLDELVCSLGTANGFGFVNLYNTLPTNHILTIGLEYEV